MHHAIRPRGRLLRRALKLGAGALVVGALLLAAVAWQTERDIADFEARIAQRAHTQPAPAWSAAALDALPAPAQRYLRYALVEPPSRQAVVRLTASGEFRRPLTDTFHPTTAAQVIAVGQPALMFSATTSIGPGLWARAYDFFADGQMRMKARVLSAITVVDEQETPELNRLSLRRWLLESALYPASLLPGGPVRWAAVDAGRAMATVTHAGVSASMLVDVDAEGRMTAMISPEDGDLSTPYHGAGEHVTRSDYRHVAGMMIPMAFEISRMADGHRMPFWRGRIDEIAYR